MKRMLLLAFAVASTVIGGCTHSFGSPVVTTLHTNDGDIDVAWVIEDEHHVIRCVNAPDGPFCQRASFH